MPRVYDGIEYLTATEATKYMNQGFVAFNRKYAPRLKVYSDPTNANVKLYKKSDLDAERVVRPVDEPGNSDKKAS